jgi:uncharacterized protein (DUF885 family)
MADDRANIADRYFDYLARCFPVMCASDEFHFLPRAQAAAKYFDRLDNLDSQEMMKRIAKLKDFRHKFAEMAARSNDLEETIDFELMRANVAGILIELEQKRSWQYNPLLYLKAAFIGLDHALNKPVHDSAERMGRVLSRLSLIPGLLGQAIENINSIPLTYHQASRLMAADCRRYLDRVGGDLLNVQIGKTAEKFSIYLERARAALKGINDHLKNVSVEPDDRFATQSLNETLKNHFLNIRNADEIFLMAQEEWVKILERLEYLKTKIDPTASWQRLYHSYMPMEVEDANTISLYSREMDQLRQFFGRRGFNPAGLDRPVEVAETPLYLNSVRGAASFAAAFTADEREKSYFYITTRLPGSSTDQADTLLKKRFHREFKMLTAHETIPGHHFLDSIRCRLSNPVRRQIESPLFYEGWASYAESLLVDAGYVHRPMEMLVDYKRRLWRSARCQVDVGLNTGKIDFRQAVSLLEVCGFSTEEARRQIDRFRLNPGYQLCYSLGCHEFRQLKASYGSKMNESDFHNFLTAGGELPFHRIRDRLIVRVSKGPS